ncbi:DNA cytosine methyltransferase [Photobacterium carnosum]|uniref:DNA cytosine methyltransferase n=1 Tax=Photobacterium carnosum TaxID=2023717 RepID=UPI001E332DDA|nr:DNA (cytosine-5-)-methyltransferase [Photobacterium carnosum]MCD9530675.1 DNA (cytosine-5-)-methyltransferase [Photobacterium carnosum]MCF2155118.1 DNA (cytosine-5-)-methyltransferase [Photobacterium carnosum]MCF2216408.1 DNA (cytosine-5-)-methyltransferase [Photobacterium carnosum]
MKTYLEFFAGVGLVREGMSRDNWNCLWANDYSKDKQDTYIQNYGNEHFVLADIWDVAKDSDNLPEAFMYTASFPCTDLSVAGNRAGLAGAESGTINAIFDILDKKEKEKNKPKIVMLENVKGFLTSNNGGDCLNTVNLFTQLGYFVDILEIDAAYFTPQSRQRVFMIAVDESIADKVMSIRDNEKTQNLWFDILNSNTVIRSPKVTNIIKKSPELNWGLFNIEFNREFNTNLNEIIDLSVEDESSLWWSNKRKEHLFNQMNQKHKNILNEMVKHEYLSYGTVFRRMRKGVSTAEMRTDGIAGCLRTPKGGSSKQILIQAGFGEWKVRLLNPREYARLQGVRDSFLLPENMNKSFFAMGDAVCVPVIEFLSTQALTPCFEAWENANYFKR